MHSNMSSLSTSCRGCGRASCCEGHELCFTCLVATAKQSMSELPIQSEARPVRACLSCNCALPKSSGDICAACTNRINAKLEAKAQKRLAKKEPDLKKKKAKNSKKSKPPIGGKISAAAARRRYTTQSHRFHVCVLCSEKVPYGEMLRHKIVTHGESGEPPKMPHSSRVWVSFVSGGLPGLPRRR